MKKKKQDKIYYWKHNLLITDEKLAHWLERNLIYCEQTHSFTHRLYKKILEDIENKKEPDHHHAQRYAFQILADMIREYNEIPKPPQNQKKIEKYIINPILIKEIAKRKKQKIK